MEIIVLVVAIGLFITFIVSSFDKKQKKRVDGITKQIGTVEPLFMKQAAEQKLNALKQEMVAFENTLSKMPQTDGSSSYQQIQDKLANIIANYQGGQLSLSTYCRSLENLISTVQRLKKDAVSSAA